MPKLYHTRTGTFYTRVAGHRVRLARPPRSSGGGGCASLLLWVVGSFVLIMAAGGHC